MAFILLPTMTFFIGLTLASQQDGTANGNESTTRKSISTRLVHIETVGLSVTVVNRPLVVFSACARVWSSMKARP